MLIARHMSVALLLVASLARSGSDVPDHPAATEMAEAARVFLASLSETQRSRTVFPLEDDERFNWHFVPRERLGISFKDMTPAQRQLAHALLSTGLSHRGYLKAMTVMSLDQVLYDLENQNPRRDPERYYVSVFGLPGAESAWAWRVEGHHLSLNFTLDHGRLVSVSPSFFGANPAEVREGPRKGLRTLGREEDLGRKLVLSLDAEQRRAAVIDAAAPRDIITGNNRQAAPLKPLGLPMSEMTSSQAVLLQRLVMEHAGRARHETAAADFVSHLTGDPARVHFAWAGGTAPGQGHYYRVQGPGFLLEYDNTQNNANHVHTVWRDFEKDFGGDALKQHYERHHRDR